LTAAQRSYLLWHHVQESASETAMQIDRHRFLLLTATMAGGACGAASPGPAETGGPVIAAPVVALPSEPEAGPPNKALPQTEPGRADGALGDGEDATLDGEGEDDEASDGAALSCDDTGITPKSCAPLRAPGPQCESFADTKSMCGKLSRGLRPRVAAQAVDCILAKNGKAAICSFDVANQCALTAARKACIEPSTQAPCATLVRTCSGQLAMRDCQTVLSAVETRNRRRMITCMTEGCSADYCMYEVE
jgi:hypothetical protein